MSNKKVNTSSLSELVEFGHVVDNESGEIILKNDANNMIEKDDAIKTITLIIDAEALGWRVYLDGSSNV